MRLPLILTLIAAAALPARAGEADWLRPALQRQERALGAGTRIGVAVMRPSGAFAASYRGGARFPLNSTSKVLLCAALLRGAEQRALSLRDAVRFSKADLVSYSPITAKFTAPKQMTWRQLCAAAVSRSDNTAANLVSARMGGPQGITRFLRAMGDNISRLDRYEPDLNSAIPGDGRDTTSPRAISRTARALLAGNALQRQSRLQLITWMRADAAADNLLRASLPPGWVIADKSGAGAYGSRSIIAAVRPRRNKAGQAGTSGAPWIIALYITQTKTAMAARDKAIAQLGKVIFSYIARQ